MSTLLASVRGLKTLRSAIIPSAGFSLTVLLAAFGPDARALYPRDIARKVKFGRGPLLRRLF
ncbi:hypothetical protein A2303_05595 [Candidatus Falkowbacteria bacterium RIFOXYB2_FULL_47_14]|uniref:Uncharacterized protein n=1 Tax=Candidatus Falkowbacteria bacterium RIFOXYA2_FULL_47_19 TaxID=1797994 RepID=A0A1F5SEF0_9BACT|nr:MAG: hypothetical protein A2227_06995 [Candidatus Falkowbacteria bacterium RIFOXYA2_FULL_47_19]OGF35320.1 MAG: hypothetical protein A2468_00150 [Candidatus Falkowbacteria bacterium RIFOXYC2_FULL_46_15]OGF43759.1 MAG: hypothetical protein A2303_05595 [Candidatus Falkowbacteria bacterium RIFOXYB2_FULL_47_14]